MYSYACVFYPIYRRVNDWSTTSNTCVMKKIRPIIHLLYSYRLPVLLLTMRRMIVIVVVVFVVRVVVFVVFVLIRLDLLYVTTRLL
jgi:hypothetical protein